MGIGLNVKLLRERRGLTFDAVAKAVGTDAQAISQMEKRNAKNSNYGPQLAKFFGVDLTKLLSDDFEIDTRGSEQIAQQPSGADDAVLASKISSLQGRMRKALACLRAVENASEVDKRDLVFLAIEQLNED